MTTETPEFPTDDFDAHLQTLFAGFQPAAGFEDRLVETVRRHRRLRLPIPAAVSRAAIAAAAMLAVGVVGYYGNEALLGRPKPPAIPVAIAASESIAGIAARDAKDQIIAPESSVTKSPNEQWDFGGGSNSAQDWTVWNGTSVLKKNNSYSYENPFASGKPVQDGWKLKNPDASYGVAADINPGGKSSPHDNLDSTLLPYEGPADAARSRSHKMVEAATDELEETTRKAAAAGGQFGPAGGKIDKATADLPTLYFRTDAAQDATRNADTSGFDHAPNSGGRSDSFALGRDATIVDRNPTNFGGGAGAGAAPWSVPAATGGQSGNSRLDASNKVSEGAINVGKDQDVGKSASTGTGNVSGLNPFVGPVATFDPQAQNDRNYKSSGNGHPIADASGGDQKSVPIPLAAPAANTTQPAAVIDDRKIIRTGTMEFDVDRFDTAQMQITKIVLELGGFVGATDSTKLPNGKVRGSISVRVPPERLDVLVLSLRALGDLKSQQIVASDITKEYTDVESELAADRAMQDRLLELIHKGKGAVKDLLAAENELGNWRAKIEKTEGMIRYYNSQVGLSTLTITLSERDIQTPATAIETETADVGIEADDVERARNSALKAIDDVKGRVVEAELKRFDAGQLAARLVADVPPESAGAVIDQLKQLGKVARLEINRQAATSDGSNAVTGSTPLKTERKPTRLLVSIYNLANVAPRRTTNVSLAATDVEAAYTALVSAAKSAGGRVVTSALDRGDPVKATGSMVLEFPPDKFESALTALHAQGDVLKLTLTENPDTQNSTEAKAGLTVQLVSLASVPPRESIQQTLAAADVPGAYQTVLDAANAAHARVQSAQLNEQDRQNISADLQLEIPRTAEAAFDKALAGAGGTIARTSTQSAQAEGTVDSKVALRLSITSADHLPPRETTRLQVETADVDRATTDAQSAAIHAGGRVLEATVNRDNGKGLARVALDLPLDKSAEILQQIRNEGTVRGIDASRDSQAPAGPLAHAQILVEFTTTEAIVADQTGPWASVRQGLSTSIRGLLWSLQWMVVGVCFVGPWLLLGWILWRLRGKIRRTKPRSLE